MSPVSAMELWPTVDTTARSTQARSIRGCRKVEVPDAGAAAVQDRYRHPRVPWPAPGTTCSLRRVV